MADSLAYLRIYFGGAVFLFLYNSLNGIYNALGDSQTPLKFLMVSALDQYCPGPAVCHSIQHGCGVVRWATLIARACALFFPFLY